MAEKEISNLIKLQIEAGKATPATSVSLSNLTKRSLESSDGSMKSFAGHATGAVTLK